MDDEGECTKYSENLMMLPLEGFWKNRYDFYVCWKDKDITEEEFNNKEHEYELKEFVLQDRKTYEKLLEIYKIKVDLSYDGLRDKYK